MKTLIIDGLSILVDDEDYERLIKSKWRFMPDNGYFKKLGPFCRRTIYLHRFILKLSRLDKVDVDHINRNKLDNQRSNLRVCSRSENMFNTNKIMKETLTSVFKGVRYQKARKKWECRLCLNYRQLSVYYGDYEQEAAYAYNIATELLGLRAYKNPVNEYPVIKNNVTLLLKNKGLIKLC